MAGAQNCSYLFGKEGQLVQTTRVRHDVSNDHVWQGFQVTSVPTLIMGNLDVAIGFSFQPFQALFSAFLCYFILTRIFLPQHSLLSIVFPFTSPGPSFSFTCGFLPLSFKLSQLCTEIQQKPFVWGFPHSQAVLKAAGGSAKASVRPQT